VQRIHHNDIASALASDSGLSVAKWRPDGGPEWPALWNYDVLNDLVDGRFYVPLWTFLVPCAGMTWWLWRRDRRTPPGHCIACGYDLTGNVSGTGIDRVRLSRFMRDDRTLRLPAADALAKLLGLRLTKARKGHE